MKTREEMLAAGTRACDIDRNERIQRVYAFALAEIQAQVPDAPEYLQRAMTRELILTAGGVR